MKWAKGIAVVFMGIALVFGILFYAKIEYPTEIQSYFRFGTYDQFGPLALCVELLFAGYYLFTVHPKTNFTLALFAFTALLDPIFNLTGLFVSLVPIYATITFCVCAILCLWIAFSNAFGTGKISFFHAMGSFLLGTIVELFFNYF